MVFFMINFRFLFLCFFSFSFYNYNCMYTFLLKQVNDKKINNNKKDNNSKFEEKINEHIEKFIKKFYTRLIVKETLLISNPIYLQKEINLLWENNFYKICEEKSNKKINKFFYNNYFKEEYKFFFSDLDSIISK
jgi:hypothetical protein